MHKPESDLKNESGKTLWDFDTEKSSNLVGPNAMMLSFESS